LFIITISSIIYHLQNARFSRLWGEKMLQVCNNCEIAEWSWRLMGKRIYADRS